MGFLKLNFRIFSINQLFNQSINNNKIIKLFYWNCYQLGATQISAKRNLFLFIWKGLQCAADKLKSVVLVEICNKNCLLYFGVEWTTHYVIYISNKNVLMYSYCKIKIKILGNLFQATNRPIHFNLRGYKH